jgi:hypothetical protein
MNMYWGAEVMVQIFLTTLDVGERSNSCLAVLPPGKVSSIPWMGDWVDLREGPE